MNNDPNTKLTVPRGSRGVKPNAPSRLFISIELPEAVVDEIVRIQREFKNLDLFEGHFVRPENLHITLSFLGSVENEKIPDIHERLARVSFPITEIKLKKLGVNSLARPHVLWITLDAPLLIELARLINEALPEYKEQRALTGHITIARMKKVKNKSRFIQTLENMPVVSHAWHAQNFLLNESETLAEGPIYTILGSFPLLSYKGMGVNQE